MQIGNPATHLCPCERSVNLRLGWKGPDISLESVRAKSLQVYASIQALLDNFSSLSIIDIVTIDTCLIRYSSEQLQNCLTVACKSMAS